MNHHIGLLQQAQGAHGQQVRVAGARAEQIDRARTFGLGFGQRPLKQGLGLVHFAGEHALGHCALQDPLPELSARMGVRHRGPRPVAEPPDQRREPPVAVRQQRINAPHQMPGQHRRVARA